MAQQRMTPRMEMLLRTVRGSSVSGNRGVTTSRTLDLDTGYFARAAQALIRRGKLARRPSGDTILWIAL